MITTGAIGFIAVYAIITNSTKILDVGLIIGLISFLGTVAFAMFIERRKEYERNN
jgi:multicomponent Na+:H+ antiporter subunit F